LIAPDKVKVPASELIRTAFVASVIAPPHVLLPLMFLSAPAEDTPSLLSVNASAPTVIPPCSSNAAPEATLTPPVVVPKALAFCMFTTPELIDVAPVYVLFPESVNVPVPDFVKPPAPLMIPVVILVWFDPSIVSVLPPLLMFPVTVKPPDPEETIVAAAESDKGIAQLEAFEELLNNAPELLTPDPAKLIPCHVDKV